MEIIQGVLLLIGLVLVGNVISHFLPMVPDALIQISLGLIVALLVNVTVPVAQDWFMLLFIAPLLYNDGRHFSRRALWKLRGPIIGNAVFLVFATMFLGGLLIHFLVPAMPFAAAVALAAILAPTDPIAVEGIARRVHLPNRVLHLVAGESLINDASGLIGFKYGIAAAVSGTFVWSQAVGDFFYVAIVGAISGLILMGLINRLRNVLLSQGIGDVIVHTVLQLLTPFVIYLIVDEALHASGVIAVVAAGIMSNSRRNPYMMALPELRLVSEHTWSIMVYVLNGLLFILLGIEVPVAMQGAMVNHDVSVGVAIGMVVLIYAALLALRTVWIFLNDLWTAHKRGLRRPPFASALMSGVAGARGAITVVGVLAVPTVTLTGVIFPERSLMLFLAAGVTLTSLIVATVLLPVLVRLTPSGGVADVAGTTTEGVAGIKRLSRVQAQNFILQTAVHRIDDERSTSDQKAALDLIGEYQLRLRRLRLQSANDVEDEIAPIMRDELEIKIMAVTGELAAIDKLWQAGGVPTKLYDRAHKRMVSKNEDMQYMLANRGQRTLKMRWQQYRGKWRHRFEFIRVSRSKLEDDGYIELMRVAAKGALANINMQLKSPQYKHRKFNKQVISAQIVHYRSRVETAKAAVKPRSAKYAAEIQRLRMVAFTAERAAVHTLMEQNLISPIQAQRFSSDISYSENSFMVVNQDED